MRSAARKRSVVVGGLLLVALSPIALAGTASLAPPVRSNAHAGGNAEISASDMGTTIFGEKEAPLGLYLLPWKNASRDPDLDRPPLLHDEALARVDPTAFHEQVRDAGAIAERRRLQFSQYH